jgi:radical SAM superfamily enzyme YgiQ (UPF0313 family)
VFERLYKVNSAQYVYAHMKYLRDRFGIRHINFYDDLFTANKRRVNELCELLIEAPLGIQFNCAIRAGHTSPEMLRRSRRCTARRSGTSAPAAGRATSSRTGGS